MMKITTLVNINLDRIENVSSVSKIFGKGIRIFPSFNPRFKIIDIFSSIYSSNKGTNKRLKRFNVPSSVNEILLAGNFRRGKKGVGSCDDFHVWRISCRSSIFDTWNKPWNSRRQATAWRRRRRRVIREPNRFVLMKFLDAVSSWHSSAERVTWLFIEFQRRVEGSRPLPAPCLRGIKLALRGNN